VKKFSVNPADYVEILKLYSAYNLASDSGDAEWYASCFTEDGEQHGTFDVIGHTALVEYKKKDFATRAHLYRRHWNGSLHLEKIDDETIRGRCYLFGYNGDPGTLPHMTHAGVYTDTIKRENGAWKFAHRRLIFDGVKK
jgi:hypothetical protein